MKTPALMALIALAPLAAAAQNTAAPGEIYHVHVNQAAAGKSATLEESLKKLDPPGHAIVLRHAQGGEWDYMVIKHIGPKATVDANTPPPPPALRDLSAWHGDTFAVGPPWAEFAKAMGLDTDAAKTRGAVYVVSAQRAVAGHRDQLDTMLSAPPEEGDLSRGAVILRHLEGAPWNFLTVTRYDSWADFAANETRATQAVSPGGGWHAIREHSAQHVDTLTTRIAP